MCLTACYWARVSRLVFGATSYDVATYGFEDLQLHREMASNAGQRSLTEVGADGSLRDQTRTHRIARAVTRLTPAIGAGRSLS